MSALSLLHHELCAAELTGDSCAKRGDREGALSALARVREIATQIEAKACLNCGGSGWIECGHPDDARRCGCQPALAIEEIPY